LHEKAKQKERKEIGYGLQIEIYKSEINYLKGWSVLSPNKIHNVMDMRGKLTRLGSFFRGLH
jgi:hypothetical protein